MTNCKKAAISSLIFIMFGASGMAAAAPPVLRYLPIGDSYTIGQEVHGPERFPNQLADLLTRDGFPIAVIQNPARSGWTSLNAFDRELPVAKSENADLITLLIGTNDYVQRVSGENFRAQVTHLMDELKATLAPNGQLIVISNPDFSVTSFGAHFGDPDKISKGLALFNQILSDEAAKRNCPFVDIFALSHSLNSDPAMVARDGLHPSPAQYKAWVERMKPVIEEALKSRLAKTQAMESTK